MVSLVRVPLPPGLPDVDSARSRQLRALGHDGLPVLNALAANERDALFLSLALMAKSADYHVERFKQMLQAMNDRQAEVDAFLAYDFYMVDFAIFEASAALSAIRSAIDEIIFIAARLVGVPAHDIKEQWKTHAVMQAKFDRRPAYDVPAVRTLRKRFDWYDELNEYRNVLRHRGCRSTIGGRFPIGSDFPEARSGEHNVMLFPDRASLIGNTRAHQWTYNDGVRLEDIVRRAVNGFESLLDELLEDVWGGPQFLAREWMGKVPKEEAPNMVFVHVQPAIVVHGAIAILPLFTDRAIGEAFRRFLGGAERLHLAELRAARSTPPSFHMDVSGCKDQPGFAQVEKLYVVVNPTELTATDTNIDMKTNGPRQEFSFPALLRQFENQPLGVVAEALGKPDRLFVWRMPKE